MMRATIEDALAKILALEEQKAMLAAPYQEQIEALERERDKVTADLNAQLDRLTAQVLEHGVEVGETVKVTGPHGSISSVYYKPSYRWDKAKLLGFAAAHPELMSIAEAVPASVQLRHGK